MLRFSLRNLLIAIAIIACGLGVAQCFPWHVCGFVLLIGTPLIWFWLLINSSPQIDIKRTRSRRKLRAQRFRHAFWITLPFVAASSLIPYWHTYYAPLLDRSRNFGWPFRFPLRRPGSIQESDIGFMIMDLVIYIGISLIAASAMQDGPRGFTMRIKKFIRGRTRAKQRRGQHL
jgi:hypothetical protein